MKMFALTTITAGALAATAQLNGIVYGPPSECTVTGVHPDPTGTVNQAQFTTVYVDISCLSTG
jgi:hypothetical protein